MSAQAIGQEQLLQKIGAQAVELDLLRARLHAIDAAALEDRELLEAIRSELDPDGDLAVALRTSAEPLTIDPDSPLGRTILRAPAPPSTG